ncbi:hypothetical protein BDN72DRAFT_756486 [Pluteus cervinus]|uniref:Uncharacterized protein n=1 Tax=Pluteus cervinus TaxID=181527 RepID=A0ACD3BE58_9AGAR|nr:hypothetical protein BDN72DRAFT_756486 [Pluteus cervinus]
MPSSFLPILACPLCEKPNSLNNPTTLHCGHSICATHLVRYPLCPVPGCSTTASAPDVPPVPSSSTVVVLHPPNDQDTPDQDPVPIPPEPKVDVTLSKVINLVHRATTWSQLDEQDLTPQPSDAPPPQDEDTDEEQDPPSTASPSPPRSPGPSHTPSARTRHSPEPTSARPRKRRRCNPPRSEEDDDDVPDLLARLREQSTRQRSTRHDQPLTPDPTVTLARFKKELLAELTCEICYTLLFQPVTTPCQHTFCAKCLQRSQDHSRLCPLCRQPLPGYSYFQGHPCNKVILTLILKAFPTTYQERAEAIEAEERDARLDTPIFVCLLSFPGIPTYLHFYEPRYRLMLRRCLEMPNPSFGMIMNPKPGAGHAQAEYGTMLEIRRVELTRDGRSYVEAFGTYRFRILERGTLDGYMVGRIERVDDFPEDLSETVYHPLPRDLDAPESEQSPEEITPSDPEPLTQSSPATSFGERTSPSISAPTPRSSPPIPPVTNEDLMVNCRAFLDRLQQGAAPWVVQRLNNWYGPMPTDPTTFSFWVALVLPIEDQERAKLFPIRSTRLRLLLVSHWIEQLNNHWWFTSGCVIL